MNSLILSSILALATATTPHNLAHLHPRHLQSPILQSPHISSRESAESSFYRSHYQTTFLETFSSSDLDYKTGTRQPSTSNWIYSLGTQYPGGAPLWGNSEHETYTQNPENVFISPNETLSIIPRKSSNGTWTSTRLETRRSDFKAEEGGRLLVEAKIKLGTNPKAVQQGIWPAFWALGEKFRKNFTDWPMSSEWDMMEVLNGEAVMYNTLHCGTAPGGPCNEYSGLGNAGTGGVRFESGLWHTVGFEVDRSMCGQGDSTRCWEREGLKWYLDGALAFNLTGKDVGDFGAWRNVAHEGHFLLLNVAVGGNWPGPPNDATQGGEGSGMEVAWVGVWNSG